MSASSFAPMPPPSAPFPRPMIDAARTIARRVCDAWRESAYCTGSPWPYGMCIDTSMTVADELNDEMPALGAFQVWGTFGLPGKPYVERSQFPTSSARCGHAWVLLGDGTVLDPTASQFDLFWRACDDVQLDRELLTLPPDAMEQCFFEVRSWRDEEGKVHRVV